MIEWRTTTRYIERPSPRTPTIGYFAVGVMMQSYSGKEQANATQEGLLKEDGLIEHPQGDAEREKPAAERRDSAVGGEEGQEGK